MSTSINSGLTSITGNVSVTTVGGFPTPNTSQTVKTAKVNAGATGAGAETTIYTVTAEKKFYLTQLSYDTQNVAYSDITIEDGAGGTAVFLFPRAATAAIGTNVVTLFFPTPIPFSSAVTIKNGSALQYLYCNISGFEQ